MNSKLTNRLQFDGASLGNPGPMGIGAVLYEKGKIVDTITERLKGTGTNNVAEYTALLTGLERARERGWRRIKIQGDSDLIIKQVKGAYRVRSPNLVELYCRVMELLSEFESYELEWIPRELNELADSLSRESLGRPSSSGSRKGTGKNLSGGSRSKASHKGGNEGRGLGIEYDGILCPHCRRECTFSWKTFRNGKKHIRQECPSCGFLRWAPKVEPHVSLADDH